MANSAVAFDKGQQPTLGVAVSPATVAARDTMIFPDGDNLPPGAGNVADGAKLFVQQCVLCHGPRGRGGSAQDLTGGHSDLTRDPPDQTVGTYWPFATTLFDFIRRAMPMHIPGSLSNDDTYALTAYLLHESGLLAAEASLDAETLKAFEMPNKNGFIWIDVENAGDFNAE
ncbi:MAG: cytochrome c [Pseudomonadota bacterium]